MPLTLLRGLKYLTIDPGVFYKRKKIQFIFPAENCAEELTEEERSESDGTTPQTRSLNVSFTSPVTITGVQLQRITSSNAITNFTMRYKLFGEDSAKGVLDESGVTKVRGDRLIKYCI